MSEYELLEITVSYLEVVSAFFGNYAAHLSIYLTLAFVAGERLTRFQVVPVSLMFFSAAELQAILMTNWVNRAYDVMGLVTFLNPDMLMNSSLKSGAQALGVALWQLGIMASLSFMWSVRHPKIE